tara:strand:+ start:455 stop:670 length:216 start_codon:yes stop_codon:yes gene_type:complete
LETLVQQLPSREAEHPFRERRKRSMLVSFPSSKRFERQESNLHWVSLCVSIEEDFVDAVVGFSLQLQLSTL